MSKTVRPFADIQQEYFSIHNYVFDVCMPALSNAGWRVLCVAIRNTYGWADKSSPTGRKEWDQISYSQFMASTGLKSPSSVSKGIQENLEQDYMIRREVGTHQGTGAPLYAYQLNRDFEAEVATTESVAADPDPNISTTKTVVGPTTETVAAATTETVETKVKEMQLVKGKEDPSPDLWPRTLAHLAGQLSKATFDQHLRGSVAVFENGSATITPRLALSVPWLRRLEPTIARALVYVTGQELAVEFMAREEAA